MIISKLRGCYISRIQRPSKFRLCNGLISSKSPSIFTYAVHDNLYI